MPANNTIPQSLIANYNRLVEKLSIQAQTQAAEAIGKLNLRDLNASRPALISLMEALCSAYATSAASIAARFYEACRKTAIGGEYKALTESSRVPDATRIVVLGIVKACQENGDATGMVTQLLARIDYEIKRAAGECIFTNMAEDPFPGGE